MRKLIIGAAVALAACSSADPGAPEPQPTNGIGTVHVSPGPSRTWIGQGNPPVTRFWVGEKLNYRQLFHVTDQQGRAVQNAYITVTPAEDWTVRGDTLIAPLTESRFDLQAAVSLLPADVPDPRRVALPVIALIDLRTRRWSITWSCGPGATGEWPEEWGSPDSVQFIGEAVRFPTLVTAIGDVYVVDWEGVVVGWRFDRAVLGPSPLRVDGFLTVHQQAPHTIRLGMGLDVDLDGGPKDIFRVPAASLRYVAWRPACSFRGVPITGQPVTLQEIQP